MPTCLKCLSNFPNRVDVAGVTRNIGNRKFCLSCSPFNGHNTRNLQQEVRTCPCGEIPKKNRKFCPQCVAKGKGLHRRTLDLAQTDACRRRYLLRTRPHRCEYPGCGITTWLGVPVPLEMDHVDGDSDNNTEENLRLLCPNCHALTPSHKGKNRGNGRTRQRVKNQRYADGLTY